MRGTGALIAAVVVAALAAPAAHAAGDPLPWPSKLPPLPVSARVQPHPVRNCAHASLACIDGLMSRLRAQFAPLDQARDHRALFSLAYLRITQGLRDSIVNGELRDPTWMEYVITDSSNHYFQYFGEYAAGRTVP